ncbi:MAG: Na(+)-translocating NADH-quinone reductase subunit A [Xanthomonadales bacterium]|nr:Na(+)-translocating NADH-quinone reductase subunit A [Xanthomonadales bacterium]
MTERIRIKRGLDIPLPGEPEQRIFAGPSIRQAALNGLDYPGLKAKLLVEEGQTVAPGEALFVDKRDQNIRFVTPGGGQVVAINRGARRVLETVVVRLADPGEDAPAFPTLSEAELRASGPEQVSERLQRSGLWTALRTRPFSHVPASDSRPAALFVTAIDTQPLAADPRVVIGARAADFAAGLVALSKLGDGPLFLCTAPDWDPPLPALEGLRHVEFEGPHPAGLPGTHIHCLAPVDTARVAWHVGYQDVIAIGRLFLDGRIDPRRVVALAGGGLREPRLLTTRLGASIRELLGDAASTERPVRVISGSVLSGRRAVGTQAYLGRYHQQVAVIPHGGERRLFGWLGWGAQDYCAAPLAPKRATGRRPFRFTTAQHGRFAAMLPLSVFERVMPLDILPAPLLRALLVQDTDEARALGCLELDEEDLALCAFVCPAKTDYGAALRLNLDRIERHG